MAADGTEREADVIIFGTGFRVQDMPVTERVLWPEFTRRIRARTRHFDPRPYVATPRTAPTPAEPVAD